MEFDIKYRIFLPKNFLNKSVNEQIIADMLIKAGYFSALRRGDPMAFEPDFVEDGKGLEVTLAAGFSETGSDFIYDSCDGDYNKEDFVKDNTGQIEAALLKKAGKRYSTRKTYLAILCMLELFYIGERMTAYFGRIKQAYIEGGVFEDVFVICPTLDKRFRIFELKRAKDTFVETSKGMPYYEITEG